MTPTRKSLRRRQEPEPGDLSNVLCVSMSAAQVGGVPGQPERREAARKMDAILTPATGPR